MEKMKEMNTAIFMIALLVFGFACMHSASFAEAAPSSSDAKQIYVERNSERKTTKASATNFTGDVTVTRFFGSQNPTGLSGGVVSFNPGARTAWHDHPNGQLIIIISGSGRVQQWGGPVIEVNQGDLVWFPPNVKHWHGAGPDQSMSHISIADIVDGKSSGWSELVTDKQYDGK